MKLKKVLAVSLAAAMTLSMAACGGSSSDSSAASDDATTGSVAATTTESGDAAETTDGALNYASIKLGEDYTDITTTIHVFNQRTDMSEDSYPGKNWEAYIADFNEMYPNITVEVETDTNYSDDSLLRLQSGDWGDIMMIPAVDKADLSELEGVVTVDLNLNIEYGRNILETSKKVQEKVKSSIENMTGLEVADVNIHIASVDMENEKGK